MLVLLFVVPGVLKALLSIDRLDYWGEAIMLSEFLDEMADDTSCMLCVIKKYGKFFDLIKITELGFV